VSLCLWNGSLCLSTAVQSLNDVTDLSNLANAVNACHTDSYLILSSYEIFCNLLQS
jgi:hypothetical protein